MALDLATLQAQLDLLDAAINAALLNPKPNWQVGHVSFDYNDYMKSLFMQKDLLIKQMRSIPELSIDTHQNGVDAFGHDSAQYYNEGGD